MRTTTEKPCCILCNRSGHTLYQCRKFLQFWKITGRLPRLFVHTSRHRIYICHFFLCCYVGIFKNFTLIFHRIYNVFFLYFLFIDVGSMYLQGIVHYCATDNVQRYGLFLAPVKFCINIFSTIKLLLKKVITPLYRSSIISTAWLTSLHNFSDITRHILTN